MRAARAVVTRSRAHLQEVNESYAQHAWEAVGIAGRLAVAFFAVLVHAAIPGVFETTASGIARDIVASVAARQAPASGVAQ
jgi:hypothetical protein